MTDIRLLYQSGIIMNIESVEGLSEHSDSFYQHLKSNQVNPQSKVTVDYQAHT